MPNYSLVADTQFKNRSFSDLLKPLAMYTQEYNNLENAVGELDAKASVWEGMANEEQDPIAYAQYKRYADDLRDQATALAQNGLNPNSRRDLLTLKRRYASEMVPIEQAYANRKVQADEQRKALLQNPTLLLSRRADMTSLDRYLDNPQLGYEQYSGALLTQQVGQAASAIAKELRDYGKGKPLDGFTKTWLQQHGYTAAEVAQAINNPDSPRSSAILNTLVNSVMADSGVPQWADRATLNQAYSYARQGLWNAVGQTQVQTYTDEAAKIAAQEASQKRVAKYAASLQNPPMDLTPKFDPRNVRTTKEREEISKAKNDWNNYKKYFYKDPKTGHWKMTNEGMKLYAFGEKHKDFTPIRAEELVDSHVGVISTQRQPIDKDYAAKIKAKTFKGFVDGMRLKEMAQGRTGTYQTGLLDAFMNKINKKYDATQATEYVGLIDPSQYDNIASRLRASASDEGKLQSYKREKQGDSYRFVESDEVDISKLKGDDIQSAVPVYGKHGNFLEVSIKGGRRIIVPYENLNVQFNRLVSGNIADALKFEEMKRDALENGEQAVWEYPDGRIVPIDFAIQDALNQGFDNFMSGLGTSVVENQKTNRGYYGIR